MRNHSRASLVVCLLLASAALAEPERVTGANYPQAGKYSREFIDQHLQTATITPTFIGKTDQFFYGIRTASGLKYYRVDPTRKSKEPLFDTARLAAQLSELVQKPLDAETLRIRDVEVTEDVAKMKFVYGDSQYDYEFKTSKITKIGRAPAPKGGFGKGGNDERTRELFERLREERERERKELDFDRKDEDKKDEDIKDEEKKDDGKVEGKKGFGGPGGRFGDYKNYSPDRKRYVFAMKHNLYLAEEGKEADAVQLTTDGEEDYSFAGGFGGGFGGRGGGGRTTAKETKIPASADRKTRPNVTWSPDSKCFYVTRTDSRGVQELFLVNPLAEPRPTLSSYKYPMPGEDAVRRSELHFCDVAAKKMTKLKVKWPYESYGNIHWNKSGDELRFIRRDRPKRHLEVCSLNTKSGEEKCLIADGFDAAYLDYNSVRYVDESDEMIWWSERSGWGHFYLYARDGKFKNAITSGGWRASRIVDIDAKNRLLYFTGNGREPGEQVYYTHLYRVRFDGTDLTLLDPSASCFSSHEDGCRGANHSSSLSPSRRYIVTTCSRVDSPPISYVLDEKGNRVMDLESTDLTMLLKTGWRLPETFCVKAADGVTTLYGNMWKPFDFDPKKKYPIIAHVYPGPQQEGVTHTFSAYGTNMQLAQIGFVVIQVGHRGGTPTRSKAYHSYGYFNLRDYALADKKAAIEQLAARHAFIDVDRVGIYGHSGGAFLSAAALLQKPYNEFFKVAVASAGNHDNNIYNDNWSETYHGLKEVAADAAAKDGKDAKDGKEGRKTIGRIRPIEDDEDPQEKKGETKAGDAKGGVTKAEDKKADTKAVETKKAEAKKDDAKKDDGKKGEVKKADAKTEDVKKGDVKTDTKTEAKKDPPKTKFEIKVPTNAELAANLKGHILLVHGDMDNNVHPAGTMRLVDALIKANKRFDMLILPGKAHGFGDMQPYFTQRMWEYFAEHLLDDKQSSADMAERKAGRR